MNEMSFESLMTVSTGLVAQSIESKTFNIPYDGYNDGIDMDLARTSEQLHFIDTYDKLQSLHSAEKLRMIKKINTAYNNKTIDNTNIANSVESFCNNAMSTEGIITNIKEKLVEIFKRFCEFIKKCITKFQMNIAKIHKLTSVITNGLFIDESEKLIDKLYKLNSELIIKISHASQITSEEKDIYLLIKSISDKMIQNCFNLYLIGVNDSKMMLNKSDTSLKIVSYDPRNLHTKLNNLVNYYNNSIIDQFFKYILKPIDKEEIAKINVKLQEIDEGIGNDVSLLRTAAKTFKKITITAYDEQEKIREQIKQEEDAKRQEELKKEQEEFFNELEQCTISYVSALEKRLDDSLDRVRSASEASTKATNELNDRAERIFGIKKK